MIAPAFQNTLTFNLAIINYWRFSYLKIDNAVSLQQQTKNFYFLPFLNTKPFFAIKIVNHYAKPLIPSESWDQGIF